MSTSYTWLQEQCEKSACGGGTLAQALIRSRGSPSPPSLYYSYLGVLNNKRCLHREVCRGRGSVQRPQHLRVACRLEDGDDLTERLLALLQRDDLLECADACAALALPILCGRVRGGGARLFSAAIAVRRGRGKGG
eukprot:scaffold16304_cov117-Isochrysis_galbana.AAC.4